MTYDKIYYRNNWSVDNLKGTLDVREGARLLRERLEQSLGEVVTIFIDGHFIRQLTTEVTANIDLAIPRELEYKDFLFRRLN